MVILQETKLSSLKTPNCHGYKPLHRHRKVQRTASSRPNSQGGVVILVRQGTTIKKELNSLDLPPAAALETLGVRIGTSKGDLEIWNIYRPPVRDERDGSLHLNKWPFGEKVVFCSEANCHDPGITTLRTIKSGYSLTSGWGI